MKIISFCILACSIFLISSCGKNLPFLDKESKEKIQEESIIKKQDKLRTKYDKQLEKIKYEKLKLEYKGFQNLLKEKTDIVKSYRIKIEALQKQVNSSTISKAEFRSKMKTEKFQYLEELKIVEEKIAKKKKERDEK